VPSGALGSDACELCSTPLEAEHAHVVDREPGAVRCACRACAVLFRDAGAGRYRTVPDRVLVDPGLVLGEAEWAELEIPVRLAFLRKGPAGLWTAIYPGPAGAIESPLQPAARERLAARTPLASACEPDVEALLVRGERGAGPLEVLLVPIDRCYELAGRLRRTWRGFDGGTEARREIDAVFAELRARARPIGKTEG
jgi:hypothetical protein